MIQIISLPYQMIQVSETLSCSVDNGVMGLMDPAHGPFVHHNFWWRRKELKEKIRTYVPIPQGFRVQTVHARNTGPYRLLGPGPTTTTIDFVLPGHRLELIQSGERWVSTSTVITGISEQECRIDFTAAWNCWQWVPGVRQIFRVCAKSFIGQDKRVIEQQAIGLPHLKRMLFATDADKPAYWYLKLKKQSTAHPLTGPTTLRWRS